MFRDIVIQECVDACVACALACERCTTVCLMDQDVQGLTRCIHLTRDCANVCALTAKFLTHNSDFAQAICELCVEVCVACRDECARHDQEVIKRCADTCHRAAEKCEKLSLQPIP